MGVTLSRLYRDNIYTKRQAAFKYAEIRRDRSKYEVVLLGEAQQMKKAISLAFNLPVPLRIRTLDAIHLAAARITSNAAISASSFVFLSADLRLLNAAQSQGFIVENPENYP